MPGHKTFYNFRQYLPMCFYEFKVLICIFCGYLCLRNKYLKLKLKKKYKTYTEYISNHVRRENTKKMSHATACY